jgi:tetratricopeptide (TPR) repeat protein
MREAQTAASPDVLDDSDIVEVPIEEHAQVEWQGAEALETALSSDTERRSQNKSIADRLLKIARELIEQHEIETAIGVLQAGAQRVPDSADIIEELAQLLYQAGRVQEAAALFDKVLRIRQEET